MNIMKGKKTRLSYQLYFINKETGDALKGMQYRTLADVCQELNITAPTAYKIMNNSSKKYCKHFKIKKI